MAAYADREHFIPLRRSELVAQLCSQLADGDADEFKRFCDLLSDRVHLEYYRLLNRLKDDYAPFDPDLDTRPGADIGEADREVRVARLFEVVDRLLCRANFRKLSRNEVLDCQQKTSDWGFAMSIDLDAFSHFALYVRGRAVGRRALKSMKTWFRSELRDVDVFQRLVIVLQQRPHKRLGRDPDTRSVFLKLFKEIPVADLEMLIPGARIHMPKMERGKLGFSLISGLLMLVYQLLKPIFLVAKAAAGGVIAYGPVGVIAALFGYGYRQYYGYQFSLRSYNLKLAQSLYYQNLDNNAGVLHRLLDSAEEQECREAILAYFYLHRYAGEDGMTAAQLDDLVEQELEKSVGVKVDFEIDDALRKLEAIKLTRVIGDRYRVLPVAEAIARLASLPAESVFTREDLTRV